MLKWVWLEGPRNKLSPVWCSFSAWINNAPVRQLDASASTVALAWVSGVSEYHEVKLKALSAKRKIICCLWPGEKLFSREQEFLPKQSGAAHGLKNPFRLSPSYFIFTSISLCLWNNWLYSFTSACEWDRIKLWWQLDLKVHPWSCWATPFSVVHGPGEGTEIWSVMQMPSSSFLP